MKYAAILILALFLAAESRSEMIRKTCANGACQATFTVAAGVPAVKPVLAAPAQTTISETVLFPRVRAFLSGIIHFRPFHGRFAGCR